MRYFFYIFIYIFLYKFFFPYKKTFFSANNVYFVKKQKYFFKKKIFFFQLSFVANEQPNLLHVLDIYYSLNSSNRIISLSELDTKTIIVLAWL